MKRSNFLFLALPFLIFLLHINISSAQVAGTNQFGLRLGGFSGIEFRHVNNNTVGIRLDLLENYSFDQTLFSAMVEKHFPLQHSFVLYVGGGVFLGGDHDPNYDHHNDPYWNPLIGIKGEVGVDYYFTEVPINIGLDLTPRFSLADVRVPWDAAFSVRYIF